MKKPNIFLTIPPATKARWTKEAQSKGLKLNEWIEQTLNANSAELPPRPTNSNRLNND